MSSNFAMDFMYKSASRYYTKLYPDQPPAASLCVIFLLFCDSYCLVTQKLEIIHLTEIACKSALRCFYIFVD